MNILCTPTINNQTPYEPLFREPISYVHLITFGCLTYATTITRHRDKLDPRASRYTFLGYPNGTKGYLLFELQTKSTFISINCYFYETKFLSTSHNLSISPSDNLP